MSPLGSLLPGLRELRAPLAAGYLWLLDLWLLFADEVPSEEEATGAIQRLYQLENVVSQLGMGIGLSFIAYLIGALSEWGTSSIYGKLASFRVPFVVGGEEVDPPQWGDVIELMVDRPVLYAEYERIRAEGQLRIAILPPLVLLVGILTFMESSLWALSGVGLVALAAQGFRQNRLALFTLARYVHKRSGPQAEEDLSHARR